LELDSGRQVKKKRGRPPKSKTEESPQVQQLQQIRQQVEQMLQNSHTSVQT